MPTPIAALPKLYSQFMTSVTPKRATLLVLIVLMLLGVAGGFHVTERKEYLIQRNFRLLNLWSEEISQKIKSYQKVFEVTMAGVQANLNGKSSQSTLEKVGDENRNILIRSSIKQSNTPAENSKSTQFPLMFPIDCRTAFTDQSRVARVNAGIKPEKKKDFIRELQRLCEAEGVRQIDLEQPHSDNESPITITKRAEGVSEIDLEEPRSDEEALVTTTRLEVISRQSPPIIKLSHTLSTHKPKTDLPSKSKQKSRMTGQLSGTINLQSFLDRLQNEQIFDDVLLFENHPNSTAEIPSKEPSLIYHSGRREMTWLTFEDIHMQPPPETLTGVLLNSSAPSNLEDTMTTGPKQFAISVPGHTYQVFTQTILMSEAEGQHWTLVGLVENKKFLKEYLMISSTVSLAVMFGLLVLVLAIPLLHLKMMGPTDPLRPIHILGLVFSALLVTGLMTFALLDLTVYLEGKEELKRNMESSALEIKRKVHEELRQVLSTLEQFNNSEYLAQHFTEISQLQKDLPEVGQRKVLLEENIKTPFLNERLAPNKSQESQDYYSDFLYAYWMDPEGSLRINWARNRFDGLDIHGMTQNFPLKERQYVQAIIEPGKRLWTIPKTEQDPNLYSFFLEPIISWTTGLNTVVASMPKNFSPNTTQPETLEKTDRWVSAIEFKFRSLMDKVVLPPGIGFAVIDHAKHRVLFHSDDWRNLRENFLVETDHNPNLHALLSAKTAGHSEGTYWGKSTSFYVLPLHPVPWSLIVFRDMEILRSVNLVGLLIAGMLYGLWAFIAYGAFGIFFKWKTRHRKAPWLWPHREYQAWYLIILRNNLILFAVLLISIIALSGNSGDQLLFALLLPSPLMLGHVYFTIKKFKAIQSSSTNQPPRRSNETTPPWLSFPNSYAFMLTSCLLILGVVPALGCFTSIFNHEMKLFAQYQLLESWQAIQQTGKWPSIQEDTNHNFPPGVYLNFFLTPSIHAFSPQEKEHTNTRDHALFEKMFDGISQLFSPLLKRSPLWGFVGDSWPRDNNDMRQTSTTRESQATANPMLHMEQKDGPTLRYPLPISENHPLPPLGLSANIPLTPWFAKGSWPLLESLTLGKILSYLLAIGFLVFWLLKIPRFIADRTLFLSYVPPTPFTFSSLLTPHHSQALPHCLLIGYPGQGKTPLLKSIEHHKDCLYFDFKAHPPEHWHEVYKKHMTEKEHASNNAPNTTQITRNHPSRKLHIVLDHLDVQWKDPEMNKKKLEFLEKLLNFHSLPRTAKPTPPKDLVVEVLGTIK